MMQLQSFAKNTLTIFKETAMLINSQVLTSDMEILSGANVIEVGTNNGTITDASGRFSLNIASSNSDIQISYVGFDYDTFKAGEINNRYVELYPSTTELDEATATG